MTTISSTRLPAASPSASTTRGQRDGGQRRAPGRARPAGAAAAWAPAGWPDQGGDPARARSPRRCAITSASRPAGDDHRAGRQISLAARDRADRHRLAGQRGLVDLERWRLRPARASAGTTSPASEQHHVAADQVGGGHHLVGAVADAPARRGGERSSAAIGPVGAHLLDDADAVFTTTTSRMTAVSGSRRSSVVSTPRPAAADQRVAQLTQDPAGEPALGGVRRQCSGPPGAAARRPRSRSARAGRAPCGSQQTSPAPSRPPFPLTRRLRPAAGDGCPAARTHSLRCRDGTDRGVCAEPNGTMGLFRRSRPESGCPDPWPAPRVPPFVTGGRYGVRHVE